MYSNNVKIYKTGMVNNILAMHKQLMDDGYSVENSKKIITSMLQEVIDIHFKSEDNMQSVVTNLKKKYNVVSEKDKAKIQKALLAINDVKDLI